MKLFMNAVCLASIACLVGCGDTASKAPQTQTAANEALNKAKQVEGILEQGAQQEKQAIDAQTK
jgi:hypothetical protein